MGLPPGRAGMMKALSAIRSYQDRQEMLEARRSALNLSVTQAACAKN